MLKNAFSDDICKCFSSVLMNGGGQIVTTWILFKYFYLDPIKTNIFTWILYKLWFHSPRREYLFDSIIHRKSREKMNSKKLTDEKFL